MKIATLSLIGVHVFAFPLVAIAATLPAQNLTGMWKSDCSDDFGFQIKFAGKGLYSVSFCGPTGPRAAS
jgi:hypothetical protein